MLAPMTPPMHGAQRLEQELMIMHAFKQPYESTSPRSGKLRGWMA